MTTLNTTTRDSYNEFEKRRILAILGDNRDLMEIASAKLYTTGKEGSTWLYSDLEGFLCHIIDYTDKSQLLILFDFNTFEKLYQFEVYQDFPKYYTVLSEDFHCFETKNGFFGLKFAEKSEAANFNTKVKKLDTKAVTQLFKKANLNRRKDKYKKGKEFVQKIKKKFLSQGLVSNVNCDEIDDAIEIRAPRYYEILNHITYDKEKKLFKVNKMNTEMKNLFKIVGVKKSDFKNESLALTIFRNIAVCYDQLQLKKMEKTQKLLKLESNKVYLKSYDEDTFFERKSFTNYEEEKMKLKTMNSFVSYNSFNSYSPPSKNNIGTSPSQIPSVPKIPIVPAVPKLPQAIRNNPQLLASRNSCMVNPSNELEEIDLSKIKLTKITPTDTPKESLTSSSNGSFLDEIRKGVQLKKINFNKEKEKRPVKINKEEKNFLQSALAMAIQQRREELTKHDVDDNSDIESDWSD